MVGVDLEGLDLLDEVRDVVGQAEEVLLVLLLADLAGDLELRIGGIRLDGAVALDDHQVGVRDPVQEHDPPVDLEGVGLLGQVLRHHFGIGAAADQGQHRDGRQNGDSDQSLTHGLLPCLLSWANYRHIGGDNWPNSGKEPS